MSGRLVVLRWAAEERTLRSTGDLAGILVIGWPGQKPSFAVDRGWEPRPQSFDTVISTFDEGLSPLAEPITIEQAVSGCNDPEVCGHLWLFTAQLFHVGVQFLLGSQRFEEIRKLVDFTEEVASQIDQRIPLLGRPERDT